MTESLFETIAGYVDQGGFVMPPLVLGALLLWYTIGSRYMVLRRGTRMPVRSLLDGYQRGKAQKPTGVISRAVAKGVLVAKRYPEHVTEVLDDAFFPYYQDLKHGRNVIIGIVTVAPLIGLLGTVAGMIETFDSLADMALFAQSGGIAGGISQALFSTQLGLCVGIPGVIVGRMLDRKQSYIEDELDQIKSLLGASV